MITIITATYNSRDTIKDTLVSVAEQEDVSIEHLIIDGMSNDDTLTIVRSFPHVTSVKSERDNGIYDAMNKGIKKATGDIVGILNSDDFYASPSILSEIVSAFEETGCDAVYGDLEYVNRTDVSKVVRYWRSGKYDQGSFAWGWMPPHPTFFVKRSLYDEYGVFNLDMRTAADYELMLRFIHKHKIKLTYIPKVLVKMRDGGASNVSIGSRIRANREDKQAWMINGLNPYWFTLYLKPIRKLSQFIFK